MKFIVGDCTVRIFYNTRGAWLTQEGCTIMERKDLVQHDIIQTFQKRVGQLYMAYMLRLLQYMSHV